MAKRFWLANAETMKPKISAHMNQSFYVKNPAVKRVRKVVKLERCPKCGNNRELTVDWRGNPICKNCLIQSYD